MKEAWTKKGSSPFVVQPLDERLHHEGGLRLLGSEPGRRPRRAVPVGAGEPRDRAVEVVGVGRHLDPLGGQPPAPLAAAGLQGIVDARRGSRAAPPRSERSRGSSAREGARVEAGVGVPEQHRVVAGLAGQQRDVGEAGVERGAVVDRPVVVQVGPRVEAGPRRPARRGVRPVVGEQRALAASRSSVGRGRRPDGRRPRGSRPATGRR